MSQLLHYIPYAMMLFALIALVLFGWIMVRMFQHSDHSVMAVPVTLLMASLLFTGVRSMNGHFSANETTTLRGKMWITEVQGNLDSTLDTSHALTQEEITWAKTNTALGGEISKYPNANFVAAIWRDNSGRLRRGAALVDYAGGTFASRSETIAIPPHQSLITLEPGFTPAPIRVLSPVLSNKSTVGEGWEGEVVGPLALNGKPVSIGTRVEGRILTLAQDGTVGAAGVVISRIGEVPVDSEPYVVAKDPVTLLKAIDASKAFVESQGENHNLALAGAAGGTFVGAMRAAGGTKLAGGLKGGLAGVAIGALLDEMVHEIKLSEASKSAKEQTPAALLPGQSISVMVRPTSPKIASK